MRGTDRVDSQKLFPPGWKSQSLGGGGTGLRCEGARFKGDVRGKSFLRRRWWVPGTRCRGEVLEADTIVTVKGAS